MTWKAYAAVSGATVLAGWLASAPPSNTPDSSAPGASSSGAPAASRVQRASQRAAAPDIEREALRLQARDRREAIYTQPQRNPFRFGAARPVDAPRRDAPEPPAPATDVFAAAVPPPPPVSLSGIAEDQVGQRLERTAILSSPVGVLLVKEGDDVLGHYRVGTIESEAVQLVKIADGTTVRLSLTNPKSQ